MKRILIVGLFAISIFALVACGGARDQEVLRVGMDLRFPPFETQNSEGDPIGISVDVALALGEFLGREVEIVNTNFGSLILSLNAGEIDVILASMSNTPERAEAINFSETYFYFKIPSLVNRAFAEANGLTEDSTTADLEAIPGARFTGITGQISAAPPFTRTDVERPDIVIATDLAAAILNVVQGQADILVMSAFPVVRGHLANLEDTMIVFSPWISSPIGMGVRQGEDELLAQLNEFVASMSESGGLYDDLRAKWNVNTLNPADWEEAVLFVLEKFGLDFFIDEN